MSPETEYQNDFFVEDSSGLTDKRDLLKKKSIKKKLFHISFGYEEISLCIIGVIVCLMIFFYIGRLTTGSGRHDVKDAPAIRDARDTQPQAAVQKKPKVLDGLEIRPPQRKPVRESPVQPAESAKKSESKPAVDRQIKEEAPESAPKTNLQSGYALQVATHQTLEQAKIEMKNLKDSGFESFDIPSGNYHQICIGPYADRKVVEDIKSKLNDKYRDSFIRKLKK